MTTRGVGSNAFSLGYDAENRLVSMTGTSLNASFVYNGDGERVKGIVNGVTTTYVGNYYEMTGTANTRYYYANGVRTAEKRTGYTDQNGVYWLLSDPDLAQQDSGSTTITAYTAGGKKAKLRYAPTGCQPTGWTRSTRAETPSPASANNNPCAFYGLSPTPSTHRSSTLTRSPTAGV